MTELQKDFRRLKLPKSKFEYDMALRIVKGERVHTIKRFSEYGYIDFTKNVVQIMTDLGI